MDLKYKSFELKASDNGEVEGYASTWTTTPDSYGDIVVRGAFKETLEARAKTGHPFPLCFNHDLDQIIGAIKSIEEDDFGLKVKASFLNTALAQEKRELVKEGVVWQFSFAYRVRGWEEPTQEERATGVACKLTKLDLYEVSLVPVPANQTAVVTEVKSGRRNSAADEKLIRDAISALQALLDDTEGTSDEGEDESKANAAAEEQTASNPEKDGLLNYIKSIKEN